MLTLLFTYSVLLDWFIAREPNDTFLQLLLTDIQNKQVEGYATILTFEALFTTIQSYQNEQFAWKAIQYLKEVCLIQECLLDERMIIRRQAIGQGSFSIAQDLACALALELESILVTDVAQPLYLKLMQHQAGYQGSNLKILTPSKWFMKDYGSVA